MLLSAILSSLDVLVPSSRGDYNRGLMRPQLTRDRIIDALRELPADSDVDDAIERLVFLAKIEAGLEQLDRGESLSHDEVKRRLGQ